MNELIENAPAASGAPASIELAGLLASALAYAKHGWPVFPCKPRSKVPHGDLVPHGLKHATTDQDTLRRWWAACPGANVAVRTGPESFLALDLDRKEGANGVAVVESLYGFEIEGPAQRTGGGGLQAFYAWPEGCDVRNVVALDGNVGMDVRAESGYVVMPPSVHPSGKQYEWLEDPNGPLPPAPAWLLEALRKHGTSAPGRPPRQSSPESEAIPEGKRNATLTSLAGAMRRKGMTPQAIEAALLTENDRRCEPSLEASEVRAIAASVGRYEPVLALADGEAAELLADTTDAGNAAILAQLYGSELRFDHRRGRWLLWAGNWWTEDVDGQVPRLALEGAGWRARNAFDTLGDKPDVARRVFAFALRSRDASRVAACLAMAQSTRPIADSGKDWDADPWLLACENGVLDLRTGKLRPGRREDQITMHVPVEFDPAARCPRWLRFLNHIMAGNMALIDFLQRLAGLCLTGDISEEYLYIFYGAGRNGKTTFGETLCGILGPYATPAATSLLVSAKFHSHPTDVADLYRRRLVLAGETEEGMKLRLQLVKRLTGNKKLKGRFMCRDFFDFDRTHKLILETNNRPVIGENTEAVWERLRLVPFSVYIPREERDKDLKETLQAEWPGILAWALEGCLAWQRGGLSEPEEVTSATAQYREEENPLAEFFADCCIESPGCVVASGALWGAYLNWAAANRVPERERLTRKAFGLRVADRHGKAGRIGQDRHAFRGIGLRAGGEDEGSCDVPDAEPEPDAPPGLPF